MNLLLIYAPQTDVSLKGVMGSMESAKSQLEGFTHMLAELLDQIGTFQNLLLLFYFLLTFLFYIQHFLFLPFYGLPSLTFPFLYIPVLNEFFLHIVVFCNAKPSSELRLAPSRKEYRHGEVRPRAE